MPAKAANNLKLPIGVQSFSKMITGGYLYVDKTELLYQLIDEGLPYFLSRPRRFGKSITISTLAAIFEGQRELFKGLWIDNSDWDWQVYPVIRLDMSKADSESPEALKESLRYMLREIAKQYEVTLTDNLSPGLELDQLIKQLANIGKVVVLIDEYDKPILDVIRSPEIALKNRDILKHFYGILKSEDVNLKFIFLTGVTKFSKVSVF